MSPALITGTLLLCAALCVTGIVLGVGLVRVRKANRSLEEALLAATEAQQAKDALLNQRSELDLIKDEFISTVSHELRTPLTSIRGALGLLSAGLMGSMDSKAQNLLRIALTNTDRLIRLINDILDLERMQSGRSALHIRRCSLRELVQQATETMTPMAESLEISLEITLAAAPQAVYFDGDSDRILQVLTNLLSNAIKFSLPGGRVDTRIEADQDFLLLRVADTGRGIPIDKLDSVFDRFEQVEASDSRQKGGTGLGLAICRTIVNQHNGSIWAESNMQQGRGPGTSLLVSLPRISRIQDGTNTAPVTVLSPHPVGTILLCDDDAGIRTVVGEHLRQHGYRILEAASGEVAIRIADENRVAAILLDLYMPDLTGWETLQRLRQVPLTANIPVVILSVLSPTESTESSRFGASAFQGWVQKPFNEHLLLAELARVLHLGKGPAHVLLVEDDISLASTIIAGFEQANVRVQHANTHHQCIEYCKDHTPDLLVLDLALPDREGFALVGWLGQQQNLSMLPLAVYNGHEIPDAELNQLRLGPTQVLTKARVGPEDVNELVVNIMECLRRPANRDGDRRPQAADA